VLFNGFETLDAFGPAEVIGKLDQFYKLGFYSESGGIVKSAQNIKVETLPLGEIKAGGILLIPGGQGTRKEVNNRALIELIKKISIDAEYVLTVCTGTSLLAKTGLIKNIKATSNKRAFEWVVEQDRDVQWIRKARWVNDGKYYTSSGVSAGIDMALGFVRDMLGLEVAKEVSAGIEYIWNQDKDNDPFA
jgi:putative intracellular protease/amidase